LDGGAVYEKPEDFDVDDFRFGVGFGVGIEIPGVGPMRIDYGIPINPDDTQGGNQIHFNTGFTF
jgi:outer membrane protein assembly factor BamA